MLNKIDGLWDELKSATAIDAEIARQVETSARIARRRRRAGVPGLGAEGAAGQGQRRRRAAGQEPPARARARAVGAPHPGQARDRRRGDARRGHARSRPAPGRCSTRARPASPSSSPSCAALRGKNQDVDRAHDGPRARGKGRVRARARSATRRCARCSPSRRTGCSTASASRRCAANAGATRREIEQSPFTKGVRQAMGDFFATIRNDFGRRREQASEIHDMMRGDVRALVRGARAASASRRRRSRCSSTRRRSTGSSARTTRTSTRCGTW